MSEIATEVLPGLVVALLLLIALGSLSVWREMRRDLGELGTRLDELESRHELMARPRIQE